MPEKKVERESRPLIRGVGIFGFLLGIVSTFVGIYLSYKVGVVAMEAFSSLFLFVFIYSLLL